jgi:hypothetical protein
MNNRINTGFNTYLNANKVNEIEGEQHQHGECQPQPQPHHAGRHNGLQVLPEEGVEADQQVKAGQQRDPFSPQGFDVEHIRR